jgi:hypothetical protein
MISAASLQLLLSGNKAEAVGRRQKAESKRHKAHTLIKNEKDKSST